MRFDRYREFIREEEIGLCIVAALPAVGLVAGAMIHGATTPEPQPGPQRKLEILMPASPPRMKCIGEHVLELSGDGSGAPITVRVDGCQSTDPQP